MPKESSKTSIDQIRDSAFSMEIGGDSSTSAACFVSVADADLYIVTENSILRVYLADEIDPERKNSAVPNGQQRIALSGSSSEIVCRSFLTADVLMNVDAFDSSIERKPMMDLALRVMNELLAAEKLSSEFQAAEEEAIANLKPVSGGAFIIPSINGLPELVKSYFQKIEHAVQSMYRFTQLFYDHKTKYFDGFADEIERIYGENDQFAKFGRGLSKFINFVRNTRHCIEHEHYDQKLVIKNFTLNSENQLSKPTIEIVHNSTPEPETSLSDFLEQILEGALASFEMLIVHSASKRMPKFGGFEIAIGPVPEGHRPSKFKTRYCYLVHINGSWSVFG